METLELSDVFCYICRSILIEPVTLPCNHVFCFSCFQESMLETSYCCPLCRKRISNWARTAKKENKLINVVLWNKISSQYHKEVSLKLKGLDDGLEQHFQNKYRSLPVTVSRHGEVAAEFKQFVDYFNNEQKIIEEKQISASVELIKKLQDEEKELIEAQTLKNKALVEEDERLAKKLQLENDQEFQSGSTSSGRNKKQTLQKKGALDNFLNKMKPINGVKTVNSLLKKNELRSSSCNSDDSSDSIKPEMHHFKPIQIVPKTPPKLKENGRREEISIMRVTPIKNNFRIGGSIETTTNSGVLTSKKIHSPFSAFKHQRGLPLNEDCKKKLDFIDGDERNDYHDDFVDENIDTNIISVNRNVKTMQKNDGCDSPPMKKNKMSSHVEIENEAIDEQRRIENMILQEKSDRELAMKLSREWEKIDKTVDRSKGSNRAYELRKNKVKELCKNKNNKRQSTLFETINNKRKRT